MITLCLFLCSNEIKADQNCGLFSSLGSAQMSSEHLQTLNFLALFGSLWKFVGNLQKVPRCFRKSRSWQGENLRHWLRKSWCSVGMEVLKPPKKPVTCMNTDGVSNVQTTWLCDQKRPCQDNFFPRAIINPL